MGFTRHVTFLQQLIPFLRPHSLSSSPFYLIYNHVTDREIHFAMDYKAPNKTCPRVSRHKSLSIPADRPAKMAWKQVKRSEYSTVRDVSKDERDDDVIFLSDQPLVLKLSKRGFTVKVYSRFLGSSKAHGRWNLHLEGKHTWVFLPPKMITQNCG